MNKTEKWMLVASLVLVLSSSIIMGSYLRIQEARQLTDIIKQRLLNDLGRFKISLRIEVTDPDGRLKSSYYDDDDLILSNLITAIRDIITDGGGVDTNTTLRDTGGTWTYPLIRTTQNWCIHDSDSGPVGGYIQIGTGATAATRADYALATAVEALTAVTTPSYSSATGNLTISAAVTLTADRTITESGFFIKWAISTSAASTFMLFRDVFAGIGVTTGDTCTVTYIVNLSSTGFNDNLGEILEAFFTYTIADATLTQSLTDTGGSARTVNIYLVTSTVTNQLLDISVTNPTAGIQVGTSSSAVGRSNYTLGTAVESLTTSGIAVISATSNVTTASVISMTADRTITEAGFFLKGDDTTGTDRVFMLWRTIFEGVAVSNGNTITITFIIILIVIPLDFIKKREQYMF